MALTDDSSFFVAIRETAINRFVHQLQRQRPALFNYGSRFFHKEEHRKLLCKPIEVSDRVVDSGIPLMTYLDPLPILGAPWFGLNWCIQISKLEIDFHPGDIPLPAELGALHKQQFAMHAEVCFGLDCLDENRILELLAADTVPRMTFDEIVASTSRPSKKLKPKDKDKEKDRDASKEQPRIDSLKSAKKLVCYCLELFATCHFEWETSEDDPRARWLTLKLDRFKLTSIHDPPIERMISNYVEVSLRVGILPRIAIPAHALVLNINSLLNSNPTLDDAVGDFLEDDEGFEVVIVNVLPTPTPESVPHNPAIEDDRMTVFLDLDIDYL